jgi:hypothetical protein
MMFNANEYYPRDNVDIQWLNTALELAKEILAAILEEINGRLAEHGNATVLKTDD